MKKILNILLSLVMTVTVWAVIRAIWQTTVRFANIFGDTGGENMALVIGMFWLGIPVVSFLRLAPVAEFSSTRWASLLLLSAPFFIFGFLTRSMPIHELAIDAVQGQHHYWGTVVPYQSLLWVSAMLPAIPLVGWLSIADSGPAIART